MESIQDINAFPRQFSFLLGTKSLRRTILASMPMTADQHCNYFLNPYFPSQFLLSFEHCHIPNHYTNREENEGYLWFFLQQFPSRFSVCLSFGEGIRLSSLLSPYFQHLRETDLQFKKQCGDIQNYFYLNALSFDDTPRKVTMCS